MIFFVIFLWTPISSFRIVNINYNKDEYNNNNNNIVRTIYQNIVFVHVYYLRFLHAGWFHCSRVLYNDEHDLMDVLLHYFRVYLYFPGMLLKYSAKTREILHLLRWTQWSHPFWTGCVSIKPNTFVYIL